MKMRFKRKASYWQIPFCLWRHSDGSVTVKRVFISAFLLHPRGSPAAPVSIQLDSRGILRVPVTPTPSSSVMARYIAKGRYR